MHYFASETMRKRFILLFCIQFCWLSVANAQLENFSMGVYGRAEGNAYRRYNTTGLGSYYTTRVSTGYSSGVCMIASVNYLFNAGLNFGLAEAQYHPNIAKDGSSLWTAQLRLWHFDVWGELKLSDNEKRRPLFMLGGQFMFLEHSREIFSQQRIDAYSWPQSRFMPKLGLGYYWALGKKFHITAYAGLRVALHNSVGYDYILNQVYGGINIAYRLKSW